MQDSPFHPDIPATEFVHRAESALLSITVLQVYGLSYYFTFQSLNIVIEKTTGSVADSSYMSLTTYSQLFNQLPIEKRSQLKRTND
jgi:hypothetical protein